MTETQVGFLYKAASSLHQTENGHSLTLLRSYYLMRCKEVTKGYGLPDKHFSSKVRCSRCCIEWNRDTQTKVKAIKLSKKQRRRIRFLKESKQKREYVKSRRELLISNEVEQICSFCKQMTVTLAPKPDKIKALIKPTKEIIKEQTQSKIVAKPSKKLEEPKTKNDIKNKFPNNKNVAVNVYSVANEVYSLNNNKNILESTKKVEKKVINNNKKKKSRYAGLCEKAVLASAKLKEAKDKQNKLNLFLKPSP